MIRRIDDIEALSHGIDGLVSFVLTCSVFFQRCVCVVTVCGFASRHLFESLILTKIPLQPGDKGCLLSRSLSLWYLRQMERHR